GCRPRFSALRRIPPWWRRSAFSLPPITRIGSFSSFRCSGARSAVRPCGPCNRRTPCWRRPLRCWCSFWLAGRRSRGFGKLRQREAPVRGICQKPPMAQFALVAVTLLVIFFGWQLAILHKAHRTFDNYAAFRGCAAITSRTETSGTCTLGSGRSIKIVRFNDRWFLEGVCRCCAWAEFVCNRTDDDYPSRKAVASAEL